MGKKKRPIPEKEACPAVSLHHFQSQVSWTSLLVRKRRLQDTPGEQTRQERQWEPRATPSTTGASGCEQHRLADLATPRWGPGGGGSTHSKMPLSPEVTAMLCVTKAPSGRHQGGGAEGLEGVHLKITFLPPKFHKLGLKKPLSPIFDSHI